MERFSSKIHHTEEIKGKIYEREILVRTQDLLSQVKAVRILVLFKPGFNRK
jgi:hypothetical protein